MTKLPRGTPLAFRCRTAIRDAAEAFWGAGWKLHDLRVRDADLHKRLIDAISATDKAFGRGDAVAMVHNARQLISLWCEVAEAMPAAEAPKRRTWK
jgi:hypothetical protein